MLICPLHPKRLGRPPRTVAGLVLCLVLAQLVSATEPGPLSMPIHCTVPDDGFVSVGIYDDRGTLIRTLADAAAVKAGPLAYDWDGTTCLGLGATAGTYHARGVFFSHPPAAQYLMKVGVSGNPPYTTADGLGGWGGNLGAPQAVCANSTELTCIFQCVEDNLTTGIQRMDASGKILGRYSSFYGWDVRMAGVMDDRNLYVVMMAIDRKKLFVARYDIGQARGKELCEVPAGEHVTTGGEWKGRWDADVRGIALMDGKLYVPVLFDDRLFILDAVSGKSERTITMPSPRGVVASNGSIYLLSGRSLLKLDAAGQTLGTVIADGLDDPSGVCVDHAGDFYISDGGKNQQVKVFSATGMHMRDIGRLGGRPRTGIYDAHGMRDPRGICIGPDGSLWVTSSAEDFQRVSTWDAKTGALKQEFFNTRISADYGKLNPDRDQLIVTHGDYSDAPGIDAYAIDVHKGTWYPAWHLDMPLADMTQPNVLRGNDHIYGQLATAFDKQAPYIGYDGGMVRGINGKLYIAGGDLSISIFDPATATARPAAVVYTHRAHRLAAGRFQGDYDQGPNAWFTWSDLDGDGKMSENEVTFVENIPSMEHTQRLFGWELEPDLSILMLCPVVTGRDQPLGWVVRRLPPKRVLDTGVPVYDWHDLVDLTTLHAPSHAGGDGWKGGNACYLSGLLSTPMGSCTYAEPILGKDVKLRLPGIDGDGWWASRNWRNSPMLFRNDGTPAWIKLGRRASGKAAPGEMYYPRIISADLDGVCFVDDTFAQTWVWTDTGLYLGHLYNEQYEQKHDGNGVFIESTAMYAYKIDGQFYTMMGDHGCFVHRLDMPRLVPIDGGDIRLSAQQSAVARPWDPDGPPPGKKPVYTCMSIWDYAAEDESRQHPHGRTDFHTRTITVDGRLDAAEWDGVPEMDIRRDGQSVATVKAVADRENLYLAYRVKDPHALQNIGTELPYCPFTSGGYIDFCFGHSWSVPQRQENAEGDVRVIMARITGTQAKDYHMAFFPVKRHDAHNPQVITSPAAQRHFDDIAAMPGLKWAYQITADGYSAEVCVKMHDYRTLGLSSGEPAGFDVSVGFANDAGTVRQAAAHWAGEQEAMVVDRPGSAALLPATWGTMVFDRNRVLPSVKP